MGSGDVDKRPFLFLKLINCNDRWEQANFPLVGLAVRG